VPQHRLRIWRWLHNSCPMIAPVTLSYPQEPCLGTGFNCKVGCSRAGVQAVHRAQLHRVLYYQGMVSLSNQLGVTLGHQRSPTPVHVDTDVLQLSTLQPSLSGNTVTD
jgi:hypothetical protein